MLLVYHNFSYFRAVSMYYFARKGMRMHVIMDMDIITVVTVLLYRINVVSPLLLLPLH
jgi:hypothetical protein